MKFEALRNGVANLVGGLVPAFATLLTLPFIVRTLGSDSYGVLVLIAAIVGYFSILDINVTAGSVKFIAEHHATGATRKRNQTISCGLAIYAAIGAAGCVLIFVFAEPLVSRVFAIPAALRPTVLAALRLASIGFLLGQTQIYLNSIPQAIRRYDRTAVVESIFGVLVPFSSVVVLWLGYGLFEVVLVRVVASVINIAILSVVIRRLMPDVAFEWPDREVLSGLARFSGFSYLSRLSAVASAQGDKLILGAMVSMSALTQYAVPFTLVNRLFALSQRLGSVLFPVASALSATRETARLREIYLYGARYLAFVNASITILLSTLAYEVLYYWMGSSAAATGAAILIILSFEPLIDSLSSAASLINDGLGHPRVTGLFAISRSMIGICLTLAMVSRFGIIGAAYAQLTTSILMTSAFLLFVHGRTVPVSTPEFLRIVILPILPLVLLASTAAVARGVSGPLGFQTTVQVLLCELAALGVYGVVVVLRREDRRALLVRASRSVYAS